MSFGVTIGVILGAMIFMVIVACIFEKETTECIKESDAFIASRYAKMDGGLNDFD